MQMIERTHHLCKRIMFKRCVSRLFLRVLTTLCLINMICNSTVMAMPDTNEKLKLNENVARVVSGIISYTHWPATPTALRLCLVPPSNYISVLTHINMISDHTELQIETLNFNVEQLIEKCDVIYYGQVEPQLQHQVISQKNGKPLLTIAESNPHCEIGSAFCLNINSTQATFSLNFDILTRSGVRVNPNVLQLARKVE
ncbi:YfiR family protein [Xenorhabdus lircayensis]|uniref:YfiR family protein n=1 Tax=Xenorhabdus lircayensis TaxID=2763499 RepID=A0ABS0U395_9GAMM|nr:YfiR family protein [Xenorhabdus lircayensis]MBI6547418.1 YfiR family protein [Xenorhabdus lircayensis]